MIYHPLITDLIAGHAEFRTDQLYIICSLKNLAITLLPFGTPVFFEIWMWQRVYQMDIRILRTVLQNKLRSINVTSSCHAGNKGAFSLLQSCCNLFRQHLFDLDFTAMQLFRSMTGKTAAILSLIQLRHWHRPITTYC